MVKFTLNIKNGSGFKRMGKGKRVRNSRRMGSDFQSHANELLTRNFQREIRNSELWPQMVAQFGEAKAEALLLQCKGELR